MKKMQIAFRRYETACDCWCSGPCSHEILKISLLLLLVTGGSELHSVGTCVTPDYLRAAFVPRALAPV